MYVPLPHLFLGLQMVIKFLKSKGVHLLSLDSSDAYLVSIPSSYNIYAKEIR